MKRPAESQLTKDTVDDVDDSKEPSTGIQMAGASALSGRDIRGLPKRALSAVLPPATSSPLAIGSSNGATKKSPEPSRFGGFTGFGSSTPSAFTFTPPVSQAKANVTETAQTSTSPFGKLSQSAPSSQPSKGFSFSSLSNPTPPSITPPSTSDPQANRDAAHKYCLSLRGLNLSFLDRISQAIQADPFVNITEILEKYNELRSSALREFDNSLGFRPTGETASLSSKNPPSMPTPPKSFFGFGKGTVTGTTSRPQATGFTPKLDHLQKQPPSSSKVGTSDEPASFDAPQPPPLSNETSSPPSQTSGRIPSPFGPPTLESTSKHDTGSAESKMTSTPDKAGQEQDNLQGNVTASSSFNFKPSAPTVPLTPGLSFLNPSKPSDIDTKSNISNPSSSSPNPFGFGTSKTSGTPNPFSFGKGSIGNPVGFAFGSPPASPSDLKPSDTTDTSPDAGSKVPSEADAMPSQDSSSALSQGSMYDADGPGEEDEVTLHEFKAHAYKFASAGEKKTWVSVGKGQMKLKGRVEVKRRILMRNSNTGHVILNFNLFPGFSTNVSDKMISFCVPGEDESGVVYQLRLLTEADAVNCQQAIQREVDGLRSSRDT